MSAPLLPQDRYIAELLGLSEEEMRWYKAEIQRRAVEGPQPAVIAGTGLEAVLISVAINLVIGVGLTIVSALLVPKPQADRQGRLTTRQRQGDTLQVPSAFAPTYGFEAVQDIAPLGDPIPLIYTKREFLNGNWFGGVRVNTPLLWSQIWSLGGNQLLRAIFLVSEGEIGKIQPSSFAIGNNALGAYSFEGNLQRIAVYVANDGGRLAIGNRVSGTTMDVGAQGAYASDIFRVETGNGNLQPYFSGAYKPSTSTSFGVYAPMANGLGYRVNPQIRPLRQLQAKDDEYDAVDDAQAVATTWKYKYCYSSKSGIVSTTRGSTEGLVDLQVGDMFDYMLSSKSDAVRNSKKDTKIIVNQRNSDNKQGSSDGEETLINIAQAVAGRQKQYDSGLQEGELYKVGSCLAILMSRSDLFVSEADFSLDSLADEDLPEGGVVAQSAMYTFRVVRAGTVGVAGIENVDTRLFDVPGVSKIYPAEDGEFRASKPWLYDTVGTDYAEGEIGERYYTASAFPQLFRCALGSVTLNRPTRFIEIGIKSTVAMQIQGICNFADIPSEIIPFNFGVVEGISDAEFGSTDLRDGSYLKGSSTGSGVGVQVTFVVSQGKIVSASIIGGGIDYEEGDVLTFSLPTNDGSLVQFMYIVTSVSSPSQQVEAIAPVAADGKAGDEMALVNGTYVLDASGGSGTGLELTIIVSNGEIDIIEVTDGGKNYKVGDVVTVLIPLQSGGVAMIAFTITEVVAEEQPPQSVPGLRAINFKAADALDGADIEDNLTNSVFASGTVTAPEKRYSFFRVAVRSEPRQDAPFIEVSNIAFCVASAKETPVYNYLRFELAGEASWEVRLEPITSWEIRNQAFSLVLLGADTEKRVAIPFAAGVVYTQGEFINGPTDEIFLLQNLQPKREIGISWTEGTFGSNNDGTYIDLFGRAAEFFVYDEITTSCVSGPEHEITYVNVIQPNDQIPLYDNLCLVGINVRATREWAQFSQFSAYVTEGIKVNRLLGGFESTHLFPEILYDFLLNKRYGLGNEISPEQIDVESFTQAAQFCLDNRFFYDGPKLNNTNWRQWAADVAATHVLLLIERGGVFFLEQAIPEKPVIKGLFTAGNSLSMELTAVEAEQRQPFSVSVKFRQERYGADFNTSTDPSFGLFPEPQERLIYNSEWGPGPIESIDVSDYCTSSNHAVKAARYVIGARKFADHTVKITTTFEALTNSLAPGDFIKVALDYTHFNQFNNGAVTETGQLVSSTPLSDGGYPIVYWTGEREAEVIEGTLVVSNNGTTATPAGIVFTIKSSDIVTRAYRIDSIQPSDEGYEIEAIHSPLLEDGTLELYAEWSSPDFWVTV